jgi:hypothetical protein
VSRFLLTGLCVNIVTVDVSTGTNPRVSESVAETADVSRDLDESGLGPAALAAIGSVALALYYYYVRGDKQRGQFIGLWPGTILGLATYVKLNEVSQRLRSDES